MNESLTIRILEQVMGWSDETIAREMAWLRLMSEFKYDTYRDYLGGIRFTERLIDWLQQFNMEERQTAYDFVRKRLLYFSYAEVQHLVELFFPDFVEPVLVRHLSKKLEVPIYDVWNHPDAEKAYYDALRRTLFLGLSDGARMDSFRRANEGIVSNEQVIVFIQVSNSKWVDVLGKLREETKDQEARFERIFLVDDFVGSGRTLLRQKEDGSWTGKLSRFRNEHSAIFNTHFVADWSLHVHHYITSHLAQRVVQETEEKARATLAPDWFTEVAFSYGMTLPKDAPLDEHVDAKFWKLTEDYYDPSIETAATDVGGGHVKRGFGGGGLPLILEHNTPNNSVSLLWAETSGEKGPPMRPLFRRAQRHW